MDRPRARARQRERHPRGDRPVGGRRRARRWRPPAKPPSTGSSAVTALPALQRGRLPPRARALGRGRDPARAHRTHPARRSRRACGSSTCARRSTSGAASSTARASSSTGSHRVAAVRPEPGYRERLRDAELALARRCGRAGRRRHPAAHSADAAVPAHHHVRARLRRAAHRRRDRSRRPRRRRAAALRRRRARGRGRPTRRRASSSCTGCAPTKPGTDAERETLGFVDVGRRRARPGRRSQRPRTVAARRAVWVDQGRRPRLAYARFREADALLRSGAGAAAAQRAAARGARDRRRARCTHPRRVDRRAGAPRVGSISVPATAKPGRPTRPSIGSGSPSGSGRCSRSWPQGRTNRQIADALFISAKTASVHVSNILAKLDVTNRGEAAAVAHRLGLDGLGLDA